MRNPHSALPISLIAHRTAMNHHRFGNLIHFASAPLASSSSHVLMLFRSISTVILVLLPSIICSLCFSYQSKISYRFPFTQLKTTDHLDDVIVTKANRTVYNCTQDFITLHLPPFIICSKLSIVCSYRIGLSSAVVKLTSNPQIVFYFFLPFFLFR